MSNTIRKYVALAVIAAAMALSIFGVARAASGFTLGNFALVTDSPTATTEPVETVEATETPEVTETPETPDVAESDDIEDIQDTETTEVDEDAQQQGADEDDSSQVWAPQISGPGTSDGSGSGESDGGGGGD